MTVASDGLLLLLRVTFCNFKRRSQDNVRGVTCQITTETFRNKQNSLLWPQKGAEGAKEINRFSFCSHAFVPFVPFCGHSGFRICVHLRPSAVKLGAFSIFNFLFLIFNGLAVKKLPVSICMIASAEAHRIGRALESVAGWAAEIIVVLNEGVNDGTDEIARKYGAKVFFEPWKGFVIQKNSAASKATQPWLLNLDADEIVTPELAKEIADVVTASAAAHEVYEFPRCTLYCGRWIRHGDWYPDRVRRLWRKDASRWIGVDPHAALELRAAPGRLRGDLLHHTSESINQQVAKTVKYADDFARHAKANNRRVGMFDLAVRPVWRFFRAYVLKLGFLDGWQGFAIAWMTSFYTFLRYVRAREEQMTKPPP